MIHLGTAIIALIAGTFVLALRKGTRGHKRMGYVYAINMLLLNATAFGIYRLFGVFGIFHFAAIVSLFTLLGGMIPVLTRRPKHKWVELHYIYMYWSVIGLYAAFASEALTRLPQSPFFGMVGLATFGIMLVAGICYGRLRKKWKEQFGSTFQKQAHM
jgi:uncharacterized membrane protein